MDKISFSAKRKANVELMCSAEDGSLERAKKALADGADPTSQFNKRGETALMAAADRGHKALVELLAPLGGVDLRCAQGQTALMRAARAAPDCVAALLPISSAKTRDFEGADALMIAASHGCERSVSLLSDSCDPLASDESGRTALIRAAEAGHEACVKMLLPTSDKAAVGECGTALMAACGPGNKAFPALLRACDPRASDEWGETALMRAARLSNLGQFKALLAKSDVHARDGKGQTAIVYACEEACSRSGSAEALGVKKMSALLGAGASLDDKNAQGLSIARMLGRGNAIAGLELVFGPGSQDARALEAGLLARAKEALRGAVEAKRIEAAKWMLGRFDGIGFAGERFDYMGLALESRYAEAMACAIAGHVDLSGVDDRGRDVLMRWVECGYYEVAGKHLGAFDLTRKDNAGKTALKLCSKGATNLSEKLAREMEQRLSALAERKALDRASGGLRKPKPEAAGHPKTRSL